MAVEEISSLNITALAKAIKKLIVITFQIEGLHLWREATAPVEYLAHPHRHLFYVTCKKEVEDNNREIEIIQFKRTIMDDLLVRFYQTRNDMCDFGIMSCEDIAEMLINIHHLDYCSVLEDNENGAELTAV